jgi:hypothetical protein
MNRLRTLIIDSSNVNASFFGDLAFASLVSIAAQILQITKTIHRIPSDLIGLNKQACCIEFCTRGSISAWLNPVLDIIWSHFDSTIDVGLILK